MLATDLLTARSSEQARLALALALIVLTGCRSERLQFWRRHPNLVLAASWLP